MQMHLIFNPVFFRLQTQKIVNCQETLKRFLWIVPAHCLSKKANASTSGNSTDILEIVETSAKLWPLASQNSVRRCYTFRSLNECFSLKWTSIQPWTGIQQVCNQSGLASPKLESFLPLGRTGADSGIRRLCGGRRAVFVVRLGRSRGCGCGWDGYRPELRGAALSLV